MTTPLNTGSCLCGAIQLETSSSLNEYHICHCGMCQQWNGGPNFAFQLNGELTIKGEKALTLYKSSDFAQRGFCKHCGTHILYCLNTPKTYFIPVGLFGDSIQPTLGSEIFIDKKPSHYSFSSDCPKFTEEQVFAMFTEKA